MSSATSPRTVRRSSRPDPPGASPWAARCRSAGTTRCRLTAPRQMSAMSSTNLMATERPNGVLKSGDRPPMSISACVTPVAKSAITHASAIGEKRTSTAASRRLRSGGSSWRVAVGRTKRTITSPPIQVLIAVTWTTSSGSSAATGCWVVAWPARAGETSRNAVGSANPAIAAGPAAGDGATPVAPTAAGRSSVTARVLAPASRTPPSSSHATARSPQMVPKRVPSTSRTTVGSSADQKLVPDAVAPCSTMPATPETMPSTTASHSSRRARAANSADASGQPSPAPAAVASAGRQAASRKARPPTARAMAR